MKAWFLVLSFVVFASEISGAQERPSRFRFRDTSGAVVAFFDSLGNFVTKGVRKSQETGLNPVIVWNLKDGNGQSLFKIDDAGNYWLKGTTPVKPPQSIAEAPEDLFRYRDGSGAVVAVVRGDLQNAGNLEILGTIYEQGIFFEDLVEGSFAAGPLGSYTHDPIPLAPAGETDGYDPVDGHSPGAVFADLNGDDWPDLYLVRETQVLENHPGWNNQVLINKPDVSGGRRFVDVTDPEARDVFIDGTNTVGRNGTGAVCADYDNDGHRDLYVTSAAYTHPPDGEGSNEYGHTPGQIDANDDNTEPKPRIDDGITTNDEFVRNTLLHNLGNDALGNPDFEDKTVVTVGTDTFDVGDLEWDSNGNLSRGDSITAAWADFNLDGYPDLYVGNHRGHGDLWGNLASDENFDCEGCGYWTPGTGWSVSGGIAQFTGSQESDLSQNIKLVDGYSYFVHLQMVKDSWTTGGFSLVLGTNSSPVQTVGSYPVGLEEGIEATGTNPVFKIRAKNVGGWFDGQIEAVFVYPFLMLRNGGFDTDTSDWIKNAPWIISGGKAQIDGSQVSSADLSQNVGAVQGRIYRIQFTVTDYQGGTLTPMVGSGLGEPVSSNGTFTQLIEAGPGSDLVFRADAEFQGSIDRVWEYAPVVISGMPNSLYLNIPLDPDNPDTGGRHFYPARDLGNGVDVTTIASVRGGPKWLENGSPVTDTRADQLFDSVVPPGNETELIVSDGDFMMGFGMMTWTQDSGNHWQAVNGQAVCDGNQTSPVDLTQDLSGKGIVLNQTYRLTFRVTGWTAGSLTPLIGTTAGTTVSVTGDYVQYIPAGGDQLIFRADADFNGTLDDVFLWADRGWDDSSSDPGVKVNLVRSSRKGSSALACIAADFNDDRWPDLYVGNGSSTGDCLYINKGAAGLQSQSVTIGGKSYTLQIPTFDEVHDQINVTYPEEGFFGYRTGAIMGIDIGDVDLDGDFDFYATDHGDGEGKVRPASTLSNNLFLRGPGNNPPEFSNWSGQSKISAEFSWGTGFFDFDNDGDLDIYVASNPFSQITQDPISDWLFENRVIDDGAKGTLDFKDVSIEVGLSTQAAETHAAVFADYDHDGDVDILTVRRAGLHPQFLENRKATSNHWLHIKLVGDPTLSGTWKTSRDALGAKVTVIADVDGDSTDETLVRQVYSGSGASASSNSFILEFGLGQDTTVNITVDWPSGLTTSLPGWSAVDRAIEITEGASSNPTQNPLY